MRGASTFLFFRCVALTKMRPGSGLLSCQPMGLLILLAEGAGLIVVVGTWWLIHAMTHPQRRSYAFALARRIPSDPSEVGLKADKITFNFRDGTTSPGWLIEGRRAAGPIVIMSHGWNSSRYQAIARAPLLADIASRVVLYDLRGHGDSTAPSCRMGIVEVDDLISVIDRVATDGKPIVLFGTSMGAGISIAAAARTGSPRVAGVIAEGAYRRLFEPLAAHLKCVKLPIFPFAFLGWFYVEWSLGRFGKFDRAWFAARLQCPLLVLHGSDDRVCSMEEAKRIAEAAPQGTLVAIEGGGHGDLVEVDRGRYIDAIEDLMRKSIQRSELGFQCSHVAEDTGHQNGQSRKTIRTSTS